MTGFFDPQSNLIPQIKTTTTGEDPLRLSHSARIPRTKCVFVEVGAKIGVDVKGSKRVLRQKRELQLL